MKKIMMFTLVIVLMTGVANSQNFYARFGGGAGLGLSYYTSNFGDRTMDGDNNYYTYDMKSYSMGSGANINLGLGYMFSKQIGVEMGFNEFIGFGIGQTIDISSILNPESSVDQVKDNYSAMMFQIVPSLVITPGFEKINPYGRFGVILGVVNKITNTVDGTQMDYKDKGYGGLAIGFAAAIGADYNLNNKIALYAEVDLNGLNYSPKKGKRTEWTIDGVDKMPEAKTRDKEWNYVKKIDYSENIPSDSPDKRQKYSVPLSNVGLNIGIKFRF